MGADHRSKPAWLRAAERQGLVSEMNATKWREVTEAMRLLPGGPTRYRVKDIDSPEPGGWDREWYYHPRPYETIEWLEIDPDSRVVAVLRALAAVGCRVMEGCGSVRIVGWLRPDATPDA
jgi:hypothetical protein